MCINVNVDFYLPVYIRACVSAAVFFSKRRKNIKCLRIKNVCFFQLYLNTLRGLLVKMLTKFTEFSHFSTMFFPFDRFCTSFNISAIDDDTCSCKTCVEQRVFSASFAHPSSDSIHHVVVCVRSAHLTGLERPKNAVCPVTSPFIIKIPVLNWKTHSTRSVADRRNEKGKTELRNEEVRWLPSNILRLQILRSPLINTSARQLRS